MIKYIEEKRIFHLQTKNTSYIINILPSNHLGNLYYGKSLDLNQENHSLQLKHGIEVGSQVIYEKNDKTFNLNLAFLEAPTFGKGDFREPMCHIRLSDGSRITDFKYKSHEILRNKPSFKEMPETRDNSTETLVVSLVDNTFNLGIDLLYSVYEDEDILVRRAIISNFSNSEVMLEKALSMNFDFANDDFLKNI